MLIKLIHSAAKWDNRPTWGVKLLISALAAQAVTQILSTWTALVKAETYSHAQPEVQTHAFCLISPYTPSGENRSGKKAAILPKIKPTRTGSMQGSSIPPPSLTFRVVRFAGILDPEVNIASSSLPGGDAKLQPHSNLLAPAPSPSVAPRSYAAFLRTGCFLLLHLLGWYKVCGGNSSPCGCPDWATRTILFFWRWVWNQQESTSHSQNMPKGREV